MNTVAKAVRATTKKLTGAEEVTDRYPGWNKYNIYDPNQFTPAERTDFIKSLVGQLDAGTRIEELCAAYQGYNPGDPKTELKTMAEYYIVLRNKGARLPNFPRWVAGMFVGNDAFQRELATQGQLAASRTVHVSVDPVDILRNADTNHFYSCFAKQPNGSSMVQRDATGAYNYYANWTYMGAAILEKCPGMAIAYINDEKGKMMGRHWLHHAKTKDGEDVVVLVERAYGCMRGTVVASMFADRGIRCAVPAGGAGTGVAAPLDFVGCFDSPVHHDLATWVKGQNYQFVAPKLAKK